MKFYINNNELSEKVFWRTLDSLVSPIQRVHILDGMKVKIADYLCWIEIVSMQIGAFIGIATMCFFQINKGNSSSDKQ